MSVTAAHLQVGSLLGGKYRIEALLGQGGMGAVYLAENVDIGRKVAVKVLHPVFAADPPTVQRFRMEARAAAAIGHPGIVDVLDLGATEDGAEFIVMERLTGETLGARIRELHRLDPVEAVQIGCELLETLAAAHDKGIVHRDLKPENVYLPSGSARRTKILDFGISKFTGADGNDLSATQTGAVMGTPLYMSPEQARNAKEIGPATDLYAIGAILYMALAGRPPIVADSYAEVLAKVLTEPHLPLSEARPELSPSLAAAVDRLLAKSAGDRPASALAARDELRQASDGLRQASDGPRQATEVKSAVVPVGRFAAAMTAALPASPPRRKLLVPALLAGVVVVGGVGVAWFALAPPGVKPAQPPSAMVAPSPSALVAAPPSLVVAPSPNVVVAPSPNTVANPPRNQHPTRPSREHPATPVNPSVPPALGIDKSNPFQ